MSFELFSYTNDSSSFPDDTTDLYVQFLYRNGTGDGDAGDGGELVSYPLFRRGVSQIQMTWKDFAAGMGTFAVDDVGEWCGACDSITLFCEAINENVATNASDIACSTSSSSKTKDGMSPAVAGVIGASVAIALFILVAATLLLGGFRMQYRSRSSSIGEGGVGVLKRSGSAPGGFKGAEKLASDTDLRLKSPVDGVGASVIRHERVGSWELKESMEGGGVSPMDRSVVDYERKSEDADLGLGGRPVVPFDRV